MTERHFGELTETTIEAEHDVSVDEYGVFLRPKAFEWMRDAGFPIDDVDRIYTNVSVKHGEDNTGHIVMRVQTLDRPTLQADVVDDQTSMWVCSCPGWHYHRAPNFEDGEGPSDADDCSHIERIRRRLGESHPDDQTTLSGE